MVRRRHLEDEHLSLMRRHRKLEEIRKAEAALNKSGGKPRTHLVIGDSHARPGVPNERFLWIGRLAQEVGAEVLVLIGDHYDCYSLCEYDRNKKGWDKRSIEIDIEVGDDALDLIDKGLGGHKVKRVLTLGNHEHRLFRLLANEPRLEGSLPMFGADKRGWITLPYGEPIMIDGLAYSHAFLAPGTGKEIGGVMPARAVAIRRHQSCVFGHTHIRSYHEETNAVGKRIQAVNVGWYGAIGQYEEYAGFSGNNNWWSGLTVLRDVKDGEYDLEWWSTPRVRKRFGD